VLLSERKKEQMALFHKDPFLNDIFGPNVSPSLNVRHGSSLGNHHVHETEDAITVSIDLPGVKVSDLKVQLVDKVLRVSGERKIAGNESKFIRSFSIDPNTVDFDNMKANLEYGVLTLTAPKRVKPTVSKTITVTETVGN
jgi:HSP20 family molecular chaperone IbpA